MVNIISHPLVQHKLTLMRDKNTQPNQFRQLTHEISHLIGYEAMRGLATKAIWIETPITGANFPSLAGSKLLLVPILRAGLIMADAISILVPTAQIGHIGLYRDATTHQAIEYLCKLPHNLSECDEVFLLDPMVGTGGSAIAAINRLKQYGAKQITLVSILAAPEGIEALQKTYPEVNIFTAAVDQHLNNHCYIVPGLGDAGDRIFSTL